MLSAVSSSYAECCPDFRPLVLLSQEPSVYLTGVRESTGADFKCINRK